MQESKSMIIIVFVLVAIAGGGLASHVWKGKFAPWWMSVAHGLIGAVAMLLLAVSVITNYDDIPNMVIPLCILVATGLSGFYLASLHARQLIASHGVVAAHVGGALAGIGILAAVLVGA
jgi:hypothetical protein